MQVWRPGDSLGQVACGVKYTWQVSHCGGPSRQIVHAVTHLHQRLPHITVIGRHHPARRKHRPNGNYVRIYSIDVGVLGSCMLEPTRCCWCLHPPDVGGGVAVRVGRAIAGEGDVVPIRAPRRIRLVESSLRPHAGAHKICRPHLRCSSCRARFALPEGTGVTDVIWVRLPPPCPSRPPSCTNKCVLPRRCIANTCPEGCQITRPVLVTVTPPPEPTRTGPSWR